MFVVGSVIHYSVARTRAGIFVRGCVSNLRPTKRDLYGIRVILDDPVARRPANVPLLKKSASHWNKTRSNGPIEVARHIHHGTVPLARSYGMLQVGRLPSENPPRPRLCRPSFAAVYPVNVVTKLAQLRKTHRGHRTPIFEVR